MRIMYHLRWLLRLFYLFYTFMVIAIVITLSVMIFITVSPFPKNNCLLLLIVPFTLFILFLWSLAKIRKSIKLWKEFAERNNFQFEDGKELFSKIYGNYKGYEITLETDRIHYYPQTILLRTLINVNFKNSKNLFMKISKIGLLGSSEINIGDKEFDKKFKMEGNDVEKIKRIIDTSIQQKLLTMKDFYLEIKENKAQYQESWFVYYDMKKFQSILDTIILIIKNIETL